MRTNRIAAVSLLALMTGNLPAQRIDPANGLSSGTALATHVDPSSGLSAADGEGKPLVDPADPFNEIVRTSFSNGQALQESYGPVMEVQKLIVAHRYEEALQRLRQSYQARTDPSAFRPYLMRWFNLRQKFVPANDALKAILEDETRRLSDGKGNADLFLEVEMINNELSQGEATCALFQAIDSSDKKLAADCFPYIEGLLVDNRHYGLFLKYTGDPQAYFESERATFEKENEWAANWQATHVKWLAEMDERQRKVESIRQEYQKQFRDLEQARQIVRPDPIAGPGQSNQLPSLPIHTAFVHTPSNPGFTAAQVATNVFVDRNCRLIEVLTATSRHAEAQRIRDKAIAVVDAPRLRSAITDARRRL